MATFRPPGGPPGTPPAGGSAGGSSWGHFSAPETPPNWPSEWTPNWPSDGALFPPNRGIWAPDGPKLASRTGPETAPKRALGKGRFSTKMGGLRGPGKWPFSGPPPGPRIPAPGPGRARGGPGGGAGEGGSEGGPQRARFWPPDRVPERASLGSIFPVPGGVPRPVQNGPGNAQFDHPDLPNSRPIPKHPPTPLDFNNSLRAGGRPSEIFDRMRSPIRRPQRIIPKRGH